MALPHTTPVDPVDSTGTRVSSRRAFVIAGATFVAGAVLGGGVGYRTAAGSAVEPDASRADREVTDDPDLRELRRLAVDAPIEELVEKRLEFVNSVFADYPRDEILWRGVARLFEEVTRDHLFPSRRSFARALAQVIEKSDSAPAAPLRERIHELRAAR